MVSEYVGTEHRPHDVVTVPITKSLYIQICIYACIHNIIVIFALDHLMSNRYETDMSYS